MSRVRKPVANSSRAQRCAIYTRVSTDHGLDQDFNSLDAQREACEAYIRSQTHEGWQLIKDRFDDGGYSGGSLERPALAKLLTQMEAGRVDIIVVYKVDRLTRSLADFAKLVEKFDARGASFVSITQSFNSTSSMGRLTLNVLLSFAQFEREVTGERIRDKIAASKRKGIWVGGNPAFGYVVQDRKLVVDPGEAATVRMIFERYLALGSLNHILHELRTRGIRSRVRILSSGKTRGGVFFGRGALAALLKNKTYIGELNHRGESFPGEHAAIIDPVVFERVQAQLANGAHEMRGRWRTGDAILKGLLYDDRGFRMMPSTVTKRGRRHRYYVSRALIEGAKDQAGSIARVSAPIIEQAVIDMLKRDIEPTGEDEGAESSNAAIVSNCCQRVAVAKTSIMIDLHPDCAEQFRGRQIVETWVPKSAKVKREILKTDGYVETPMRSETRATMLLAIAKSRAWLAELTSGSVPNLDALADREGRTTRSITMSLSLAFLAPDIVQAAVDGTLPKGIGVTRLFDLPAEWTQQRSLLGLSAPAPAA